VSNLFFRSTTQKCPHEEKLTSAQVGVGVGVGAGNGIAAEAA
jgi:hypothetical protein